MTLELLAEEIELLNKFYEYLKLNPTECILDTIQEFALKENVEPEQIGLLIGSDSSLKAFTEENLKRYNYIRTQKHKIEEW